ncbi:hypothetical protein LRAMOSA05091 [Lichtheimia ramosa]|uniref:Uncharacterized protein n=1 Tax=Lichtheimia ramosa TaxID=688394 RepID=A0A077X1H0_9FUNG|nr:hypothetical protein LRAMOSA05091 [Lichtheimia ramosa]
MQESTSATLTKIVQSFGVFEQLQAEPLSDASAKFGLARSLEKKSTPWNSRVQQIFGCLSPLQSLMRHGQVYYANGLSSHITLTTSTWCPRKETSSHWKRHKKNRQPFRQLESYGA